MDSDCEGRFGSDGKCGNSLLRKKVREKSDLNIFGTFLEHFWNIFGTFFTKL